MEHGAGGLRAAAAARAAGVAVPEQQPDGNFPGGNKPYHKSKSFTWDAGTFANEILPSLTQELEQMGRARQDSVGSAALGGTPIDDDFAPMPSSTPPPHGAVPSSSDGILQLDTSHRRVMSMSAHLGNSSPGFSSFALPEEENPAMSGKGEELGGGGIPSPLKFDIGPVPVAASNAFPPRSHGKTLSFGAPGDAMFLDPISEQQRKKHGGDGFSASGVRIADPPGSARPPHKRRVTFGGMPDFASPEAAFTSGLRQFDIAPDGAEQGHQNAVEKPWGGGKNEENGSGDVSPAENSRTPSPLQSYGGGGFAPQQQQHHPELQQHVPANMMMDGSSGGDLGGGSWKSMVTGPYVEQYQQYPEPMSRAPRGQQQQQQQQHSQSRDPNMHHPRPNRDVYGNGMDMGMGMGGVNGGNGGVSGWPAPPMDGGMRNGGGVGGGSGMPPMSSGPFPPMSGAGGMPPGFGDMPPLPGNLNHDGSGQTPQQQQMYVQQMAHLVYLQQQYMQAYMHTNGGQLPPKGGDMGHMNLHGMPGVPLPQPYLQTNQRRHSQQQQQGYHNGTGGYGRPQRGQGKGKQRGEYNGRNDSGGRRDNNKGGGGGGGRHYNNSHHDGGGGGGAGSLACPSLAEYKMSGRRPTMEELAGHVVEFSRDAHGSRFVQFKMEIATPAEKDLLIGEVLDEAVSLMQDTFGNYVVQNFLEHASASQRVLLAQAMCGSMFALSAQAHGCRVVQRAFDLLELPERNKLLAELLMPPGNVSRSARNSHATHVLQKAVNILIAENRNAVDEESKRLAGMAFDDAPSSRELLTAVEKAVCDDFQTLAVHPHAYRLVLHVLGNCSPELSPWVVKAMQVIESMRMALATDQHGNFILQHILDKATPELAAQVQAFVCDNLFELSQHKFGSHLVEKCIACSTPAQSKAIITELLRPTARNLFFADNAIQAAHGTGTGILASGMDVNPLVLLMQDPYANFVVQKAFDKSVGDQRVRLYDEITSRTDVLTKFTYGRHILSHINREIGGGGGAGGGGGGGGHQQRGGGGGGHYNQRRG